MDNSKSLLALLICFSFAGSLVSADYIDCRRNDSTIEGGGAAAASGGSHSIVKSWMPEQIWVNEDTGDFGTSKHPKDKISIRTSRGGYKLFASTSVTRPSSVTYIVNLKRMEKSASVLMTASGFKNMGPVRYDCSFSSSTNSTPRNTSSNSLASYFKQMSQCDRKYVQQFLKGQGTYNGSIDGIWGNGTARGLSSVQRTGKLKGLSDLQVLKRLAKNPVCD